MALSWQHIAYKIIRNEKISNADKILHKPCKKNLLHPQADDTCALPPIMRAHFQSYSSKNDYIKRFEDLSLAIRCEFVDNNSPLNAQDFKGNGISPGFKMETIEASHIISAVKEAISELTDPTNTGNIKPAALKIVGYHINGDLDLTKLDIPFSVRLIGCYIKGAIILDRAKIISLDVSGSVIKQGISALYLEAKGSIRARKTTFLGPVDMAAVIVKGTFDLTDAIVFPQNNPHISSSYVGNRGMLNIAMGQFSHTIRLERARIYGGLNMRGITVKGMLFMNDIVLKCPLAHFELMATAVAKNYHKHLGDGTDYKYVSTSVEASVEADQDISNLLHNSDESRCSLETIGGMHIIEKAWDKPDDALQFRLMRISHRASESALRAEGATFGGPIYAHGMRVSGRVRFKTMTCNGGISFNGSRFRTPRSILADIKKLYKAATKIRHKTLSNDISLDEVTAIKLMASFIDQHNHKDNGIKNPRSGFRREFVLDFRGAVIGGPLSFGRDVRNPQITKACDKVLLKEIAGKLYDTNKLPSHFYDTFAFTPRNRKVKLDKETDIAFDEAIKKHEKTYHTEKYGYEKDIKGLRKKVDDNNDLNANEEHSPEYYQYYEGLMEKLAAGPDKPAIKQKKVSQNKGDQKEGFCKVFSTLERLDATLVIGEIRLRNAVIKGGLSFNGMIANVFDEDNGSPESNTDDRHTLYMRNVTILGDFDLRNSVGISSIVAKQATIEGSVRFCDKVKYDTKTMQYRPLGGRAIFPHNKNVKAGFHFQRAKIKGDAIFLFDRKRGPNIFAGFANIGGKLQILPALSDLILGQKSINERYNKTDSIQLPKIQLMLFLQACFSFFFRGKDIYDKYINKIINTIEATSTPPPIINLESVTTPVFVHPPSAWPNQDGLIITGMKYEGTKVIGPLTPIWRSWPIVWRDLKDNRDKWLPFALILSFTLLLIFLIYKLLGGPYTFGINPALIQLHGPWQTGAHILQEFGIVNVFALCIFSTIALTTLSASYLLNPTKEKHHPLAVQWLLLQRRQLNTRQILSEIRPSGPYIRAAAVLRGAGLYKSASAVELERMRGRENALSWRTSAPLKIILKLFDVGFGYGFKPTRSIFLAVGILFLSAGLFNIAHNHGIIKPQQIEKIHAITINCANQNIKTCDPQPVTSIQFNSTLFAVDMFFPFVDLNIKKDWQIIVPSRTKIWQWLFFYLLLLPMQFLGWIFMSLIILSIAARVETIMARSAYL